MIAWLDRLGSGGISAALGGFGLGTAAIAFGDVLSQRGDARLNAAAVCWLLAAFVVGLIHRRNRVAAWGGQFLSVAALLLTHPQLARFPPAEWSGLDDLYRPIAVVAAGLAAAIVLYLGPQWSFGSGPRRVLGTAAFVLGGVALVATGATAVTLRTSPAAASFQLDLPLGWNVIPREAIPWDWQVAYGNQLTAVLGSTTPPPHEGWPADPVVGVSVHRGGARPDECLRSGDIWAGPESPLYQVEIITSEPASLPVGNAYREIRANEQDGSRIYGYGVVRERRVWLVTEPLCYIVAVTLPADDGMTEADATAIVETFRFR